MNLPWATFIFGLFGGIGILLYGIQVMGEGLQKILGRQLRRLLETVTGRPVWGVLAGILVTTLFQSSTATTVILVGLSNATVITLRQTMPIILGSDIGTVITAQLIAMKFSELSLLIVGFGAPVVFFARQDRYRRIGQAVMGFGLLFLGLKIVGDSLQPLQQVPAFSELLLTVGDHPLPAIAAASVVTFLIHSSAAILGIIMALAGFGLVDLTGAIYLVAGCNLGTSFTALLSSLGSRREAQRVALAHFFSKLGGTVLFFLLAPWVGGILRFLPGDPAFQVANAHTLYNVGLAVLFLPFVAGGSLFLEWLLPDRREPEREPKFLREEVIHLPAAAIGLARRETVRLSARTLRVLWYLERAITQEKPYFLDRIAYQAPVMALLFKAAVEYLTRVLRQPLSGGEHRYAIGLIHILDHLEKISHILERDIKVRLETKLADRVVFSPQGKAELVTTVHRIIDQFRLTHKGLVRMDYRLAEEAVADQSRTSALIREYRRTHIHRLTEGIKESEATSNLHLDLLNSFRQISEIIRDLGSEIMEELSRGQLNRKSAAPQSAETGAGKDTDPVMKPLPKGRKKK